MTTGTVKAIFYGALGTGFLVLALWQRNGMRIPGNKQIYDGYLVKSDCHCNMYILYKVKNVTYTGCFTSVWGEPEFTNDEVFNDAENHLKDFVRVRVVVQNGEPDKIINVLLPPERHYRERHRLPSKNGSIAKCRNLLLLISAMFLLMAYVFYNE